MNFKKRKNQYQTILQYHIFFIFKFILILKQIIFNRVNRNNTENSYLARSPVFPRSMIQENDSNELNPTLIEYGPFDLYATI